jgi:hypothetical protein
VLTNHHNDLILGIAATAANNPDGPEAAGLITAARGAGAPVTEVLGDTAYGDGDARVAVQAAGIMSQALWTTANNHGLTLDQPSSSPSSRTTTTPSTPSPRRRSRAVRSIPGGRLGALRIWAGC